MLPKKIETILQAVKVPLEHPHFFSRLFTLVSRKRKESYMRAKNGLKRICVEEYDAVSRRLDRSGIQESCSVRNILRTRTLASYLIDDQGEINKERLAEAVPLLSKHLYSLGPDRQFEAKRQEQILNVLKELQNKPELVTLLKRIGKPYQHPYADQIIRDTLQLPSKTIITDAHARRAALSAWMCYLRQNVGSCFATAPAIIIHDEQPHLFLTDLSEMLGTGRLKRTFGGVEYSVPLSNSWGAGDLMRQFFLVTEAMEEQMELWLSPGLISALEDVGLLDPDITLKERIEKSKPLIINALKELAGRRPVILVTPEDIIRKVLMQSLKITEQELEEFEKRPQGMIHTGLMIQVPTAGRGKKKECKTFVAQFEQAKNAFKGLADNALLKSWEFTLASFAETKAQFAKWNLYSSLGLGSNEEGGIGNCLYEVLKRKVDECNQKVHEHQEEYEAVYQQVKFLERRVQRATSEQEAKWMRSEYQAKANEFRTIQEIRDRESYKAQRFAQLFQYLIDWYIEKFRDYFQEVYDADMHEVTTGPYDDSPAGFRLLYKYGRSNSSQWSLIYSGQEYIDSLKAFFIATETELSSIPELKGLQREISEIVTAIVSHIKTKKFLETAFYRMAAAHNTRIVKDPLEHMDKIEKKPWVYTSGGTMGTLVSTYYYREEKPTEVSRWVENPIELLVFIVDTLKQLPPKVQDEIQKKSSKALLMHSPTHAFLLKPGLAPLFDAWNTDAYTYTWVRDHFYLKQKQFLDQILLDADMMRYLIQQTKHHIPEHFHHAFDTAFSGIHGWNHVPEFRDEILQTVQMRSNLQAGGRGILSPDEVDSLLYTLLPIFPVNQLEHRVRNIFAEMKKVPKAVQKNLQKGLERIMESSRREPFMTAKALQDICKALICLISFETSTSIDFPAEIAQAAQNLGYAMPTPVIFADTNWVRDDFGFVVNPGTGEFELWRMDYTGGTGAPMSDWKHWLDGTQKQTWGVYTRPQEYTG